MAENLIEKLLSETVRTGGTYAEFIVFQDKISFISDGGTRKSTRNYRQTKKEIKESEKLLKRINERNLLFSETLKRLEVTFSNGRNAVFQRSEGDTFKSSPNLCVKFFRQCYVAGDVLASLVYPEARLEETVKGAEHLVRGSLDSFRLACY